MRYLRLSLTDRCSLRCRYCVPEGRLAFLPRRELLSFEEIERLVACFVGLGIDHVRLTGGEPLMRRDVVALVARLAQVSGLSDLALTTNGLSLADLAAPLRAAGLGRLNVSLDTLRPERFSAITRRPSLARVLAGLEAARRAGFASVKLNTVVVRGVNDDELAALVRFAAERGIVPRFIEYMPIGVDAYWGAETFVPTREILGRLGADFRVGEPIGAAGPAGLPGGGPAVYRELSDRSSGRTSQVGFIGAVGEAFCRSCNRVRVTAAGRLQECLAVAGVVSLRDALRAGASDDEIVAIIQEAVRSKAAGHAFAEAGHGGRSEQSMCRIGG